MNIKAEKKGSLFGDVARIASGTAVAQAATILIAPVLTRLYSPDAFGVFGLYLSVVGIIGVNSTLHYHLAIMLPDRDEDASALAGISFFSTMVISSVSGLLIYMTSDYLSLWFEISVDTVVLWIVPVAIFLNACLLILRQWHIRKQSFSFAASGDASKTVASSAGQLTFGLSGFTEGIHLVYSNLAGLVIAFGIYLKTLPDKDIFRSGIFDLKRMKILAYEYKKFPKYSTISGVINKLAWELPSFMLTGFFSTQVLGFYVLGHRLLRLPVSLIGSSIGEVYFERGSKKYKTGSLKEITELVLHRLIQVGFFPFFVLMLVGEDLFLSFFGEEWGMAGVYSQILAMWTFVWFISGPLGHVFNITNKQDQILRINVILFLLRLTGLLAGGLMGSAIMAITFFSAAGILGYGYLILKIAGITKIDRYLIIKEVFSLWLPCLLFALAFMLLLYLEAGMWWVTGLGVLGVVLYYPYILWKDPELQKMLKNVR